MLFEPQTTSDAPQSKLTSEWRSRKRGVSEGSTCEEMLLPVLTSTVGKRFVKKHPYVPCSEVIHCTFISVPPALCTVTAEDNSPSSSPSQAATAAYARSVSIRRGGQRWSSLVSARTSRIGKVMLPVLGEEKWSAFVGHATKKYKAAFISAFDPPSQLLSCVGTCSGAQCPTSFRVDFSSPGSVDLLKNLHLDHEQDLQVTLDMWKHSLPPSPTSWHDGIDAGLLCHLLVGTSDDPLHGPAMLRFRCGPASLGDGGGYCHQLNMPHYRNVRHVRLH